MPTVATEKLRNVVMLSHSGAGKTALSEAMLLAAGDITRMGTTEDGTTSSDFEAEEVRRKTSIQTSVLPCNWKGLDVFCGPMGMESQANVLYRNDRAGSYPNPPYNTRSADNPFTPPATGIINLQGFLLYAGDDGTFAYSSPARANWTISPMQDSDFEVAVAPPMTTSLSPAMNRVGTATSTPSS